jgi:hypothetical protein
MVRNHRPPDLGRSTRFDHRQMEAVLERTLKSDAASFLNGSLESQTAADSAKKRRQGRVKKMLNSINTTPLLRQRVGRMGNDACSTGALAMVAGSQRIRN